VREAWLADPRLRTVLEVGDVLISWLRDDTEQGRGLSQVHEEIDRRFREAGVIPLSVRRIMLEAGAAAPRSPQEA